MDRNHFTLAASAGAATALVLQRLISVFINRKTRNITTSDALRQPPPHPSWTPPESQPPPYDNAQGWHSIDPATTPADRMYPLVISSVVPRPIAFVSTVGEDGSRNLAPYSYFNVVGHAPPLVASGFCATGLREHGRKDSLFNILHNK